MIKAKLINTRAIIALILFLSAHQNALAKINATNKEKIFNPSSELNELQKEIRARGIFSNFNYRDIKYINWPSDHEEFREGEIPVKDKFTDVADRSVALGRYCRIYALQYSNELQKSSGIKTGSIAFESICDLVQTSLKNVKDVNDEVFRFFPQVIAYKFDQALFNYYNQKQGAKNTKFPSYSLFDITGISYMYYDLIYQILISISLCLNFFLLWKCFRHRQQK